MNKVMVALITPFTEQDEVDYDALHHIIVRLLQQGVDGFIVCGTTAETPTLSIKERFDILEYVLNVCHHTVEIWFGCGGNCTRNTLDLCLKAQDYDIEGILLCAPYYNRPSQEGIYRHIYTIAQAIPCNIMLYNIPSRCGVEIQCDTILRLCENCPNVVALKQASHDTSVVCIKEQFPDFLIYSGEDAYFDEAMDAGMDGLISVMGHVNLVKLKAFIDGGRKDNYLRKELYKEAAYVFMEPSPGCVKYILAKQGMCANRLRLPMCEISSCAEALIDSCDMF